MTQSPSPLPIKSPSPSKDFHACSPSISFIEPSAVGSIGWGVTRSSIKFPASFNRKHVISEMPHKQNWDKLKEQVFLVTQGNNTNYANKFWDMSMSPFEDISIRDLRKLVKQHAVKQLQLHNSKLKHSFVNNKFIHSTDQKDSHQFTPSKTFFFKGLETKNIQNQETKKQDTESQTNSVFYSTMKHLSVAVSKNNVDLATYDRYQCPRIKSMMKRYKHNQRVNNYSLDIKPKHNIPSEFEYKFIPTTKQLKPPSIDQQPFTPESLLVRSQRKKQYLRPPLSNLYSPQILEVSVERDVNKEKEKFLKTQYGYKQKLLGIVD